jgi:hypothetical protein
MNEDTAIPVELDHDILVAALGVAMRSVTIRLIDCVGIRETRAALFAEAISCAQADMTPDQIAVLLRGLAEKIDAGYLNQTEQ